MKIIYYCQHVLGVGHFFRTLEICRAFTGHEVILISGGPPVDISLPDHVRMFRLPGLIMDTEFKGLLTVEREKSVEQVKKERQQLFKEYFKKVSPDLFILELYPFGRKAFRFEIDPILETISIGESPSSRVVCSLRDILVEKKDQVSYETRVLSLLNRHFNALLVHSDPRLFRLEETFSRTDDIEIPLIYTGFVTPRPAKDARSTVRRQLGIGSRERLVIASAGGGNVGAPMLEAVMNAYHLMNTGDNLHVHVFTGPFMETGQFDRLKALSNERMKVFRFTDDFASYLAGADLSVSMAGYNTCMNILAAEVPALVWPFSQNREQRLRAGRLARLGLLEMLRDEDIQPHRLADLMEQALLNHSRSTVNIDLNGAENTKKWLEEWMQTTGR